MANKKQAVTFRAQADTSNVRTETLFGRDYTVVPVVALVEGVMQSMNSPQPELALASEFGKFAASWNGRPLVMGHPQVGGVPVSANSPELLEDYQFGALFNTRVENKKLITEAWVDNTRAKELGDATRKVLESLQGGEVIEVSTGLWTEVDKSTGFHGQARYEGIWKGIVPDHLAILPEGAIGACSVEGGCGTNRTNAAGSAPGNAAVAAVNPPGGPAPVSLQLRGNESAWRATKSSDCGCGGSCGGHGMADPHVNQDDLSTLSRLIASIKAVFAPETPPAPAANANAPAGDPPASPEATTETDMSGQNAPGAGTAPTNPTVSETGAPPAPAPAPGTPPAAQTTAPPPAPVVNTTPPPAPPTVINQTVPAAPTPQPTFEQLLANADPALRESIQQGQRMLAQRKSELIGALKASGRCKFDDAYLNAQSIQVLEQMAELAAIPNYGGVAPATPVNANAGGLQANEGPPPAPVAFPVVQPGATRAA